jgi:hypothetical protein
MCPGLWTPNKKSNKRSGKLVSGKKFIGKDSRNLGIIGLTYCSRSGEWGRLQAIPSGRSQETGAKCT